ncbi:ice-binding family protein [Nannocystis sp.]|uniref:ice-binding family protein n=1 Tax=Nannocystis sp. TaxID=1962667 RepID=UPI0025D5D890|nr:ice-binding family protein [Nannocystis sp.]
MPHFLRFPPLSLTAIVLLCAPLLAACGDDGGQTTTSNATGGGSSTNESNSSGDTPTTANLPTTGGGSQTGGMSTTSEPDPTEGGGATGDSTTSNSAATGDVTSTGDAGTTADTSGSTGDPVEPGSPVDLGTAGNYVLLAKTGISNVPKSAITGDLGVSPAAATYITGFNLIADPSNEFATSTQVSGKIYAATYKQPTPTKLTSAIGDMQLAFSDAASRAPDVIELGAGNIGGMVLPAGVYKWGTGLQIPSDVTLTGNATEVWVFQIAQDLVVANAVEVTLTGGAVPRNVFWQVDGTVKLGTTSHMAGVVLSQTGISMKTGASLDGRLLAQTAITLSSNTISEPAP